MTRSSRRLLSVSFAIAVSAFAWPGSAATPALPDFGGYWGRNSTDFEPPLSGPGPVTNKGKTFYARFGDDTNPILKPEAAERIRQASKLTVEASISPRPPTSARRGRRPICGAR